MTELEQGQWARTTSSLPLFRTVELRSPDVLHSDHCGTRLDDSGHPVGRRCTCYRTKRRLDERQVVQIVQIQGLAALVDPLNGAPCWVELAGLTPDKRPRIEEIRRRSVTLPPPDFMAVDRALLDGPIRHPRRRRCPHGGEIVLVRSEMNDKDADAEPMRLLCQILRDDTMTAVLIDPKLTFDQALSPSWSQRREIPLKHNGKDVTLAQALVPVFPLEDGTDNPGWIPFERAAS
jgi:hypothetical protein